MKDRMEKGDNAQWKSTTMLVGMKILVQIEAS